MSPESVDPTSSLPKRKPERHSGYAKPVLGIVGGIGSGKSFVAQAFGELGCGIIDSDKVAHEALELPEVRKILLDWWGPELLTPEGAMSRKAIAGRVFGHPAEVAKLNALVHPKVEEMRQRQMKLWADQKEIRAVIWDTPLLFEVGLDRLCDHVIFVKVPLDIRLRRVQESRGWSAEELNKREKSQFSLDKKELLADYIVDNSGEVSNTLRQVHEIFSQILALRSF